VNYDKSVDTGYQACAESMHQLIPLALTGL
jgi:hypothetical protein